MTGKHSIFKSLNVYSHLSPSKQSTKKESSASKAKASDLMVYANLSIRPKLYK